MSEPSLVHYANRNLKNMASEKSDNQRVLSLFKKNNENSLKAKPPVMKKMVKDSGKQASPVSGSKALVSCIYKVTNSY